jgi:thymidine kinase
LPERKNDSLQYEKGKHYDFDSEGNLIPKATFKNIDKKELPKVIIIDEVSRFTDTELKIINEFAKIHGIPVITAGDLHQISAIGKCEINI